MGCILNTYSLSRRAHTTALHARSTHVTWPIGDVLSVDTSVIKPAALWPRFSIIDVQISNTEPKCLSAD